MTTVKRYSGYENLRVPASAVPDFGSVKDGFYVGEINGMTLDEFVAWAQSIRDSVASEQRAQARIDFEDGWAEGHATIHITV